MTTIKSFLKTILYIPLFNILVFFVWLVPGDSVGWAIIIVTVLIRILLLPSSLKSVREQKKLQNLQPELEKIKEKYKGDKTKQAQATMELYKQYKVNPFGSCLPLIIQLVILFILYRVFMDGLNTARFDLLYSFIPRPETMNTLFWGMNLSQPNIYLAVLAGLLQFWQSKQITASQIKKTANQDKKDSNSNIQNILGSQMTYVLPIFTVFIGLKLPSALALYWVITTLFMIGQQWWALKQPNLEKVSIIVKHK